MKFKYTIQILWTVILLRNTDKQMFMLEDNITKKYSLGLPWWRSG